MSELVLCCGQVMCTELRKYCRVMDGVDDVDIAVRLPLPRFDWI